MTLFVKSLAFGFLLAAAALSAAADFSDTQGLAASAGFEYEFISQEYYDAVVDTAALDVIEVWRLAKDEIDDLFFRTNIGYRYKAPTNRLEIISDLELSGERFLGRAQGSYQVGSYDNNLRFSGKFENKSPFDAASDFDEGYNYVQADLRTRRRLSSVISVNAKAGIEHVVFEGRQVITADDDPYTVPVYRNYDYFLAGGGVGGQLSLSDFAHRVFWEASFYHRNVPDSSNADYDHYRAAVDYTFLGSGGYIDVAVGLEQKNYATPLGLNDYSIISLSGRWNRDWGRDIEGVLALYFDGYNYRVEDAVNRDYRRYRAELKGAKRIADWSAGPLVRYENRDEQAVEDISEGYSQYEGGGQTDYFGAGNMFLTAELTYGRREYGDMGSLLTSYNFISASLLASIPVYRSFRFQAMFDGSFETHERKEENSNLYLMSVGVSADF